MYNELKQYRWYEIIAFKLQTNKYILKNSWNRSSKISGVAHSSQQLSSYLNSPINFWKLIITPEYEEFSNKKLDNNDVCRLASRYWWYYITRVQGNILDMRPL